MLFPLVVVLALHADKNDAEQQFHQMEMKLVKAKTLECTYEAKIEGGKANGSLKGSLALAAGNKSRLEMRGNVGGVEANNTMISDGEKLGVLNQKAPKPQTAQKWLNDAYRAALSRSGLMVPLMFITRVGEQPKEFKADVELKVSDFQLGKKEKVGEHEAQAIRYQVHLKEFPEPLAATVWLDTKTNLPLKREITAKKGDNKITVTETYTKMKIDGKIDPKQFELPK